MMMPAASLQADTVEAQSVYVHMYLLRLLSTDMKQVSRYTSLQDNPEQLFSFSDALPVVYPCIIL